MTSLMSSVLGDGLPIPKFVLPVDPKYKCILCVQLLVQPRQLRCGHRMCLSCVEELFLKPPARCPVGEEECRLVLTWNEIYPDNSVLRELRTAEVFCLFQEHGCEQTMKWNLLKAHVERCEYRVQRCEFCRQEISRFKLQIHIDKECPQVEVVCPNNCSAAKIVRSQMNVHLDSCPLNPKPCYLNEYGCSFMAPQEQLRVHNNDHMYHLKLLGYRVIKVENDINKCLHGVYLPDSGTEVTGTEYKQLIGQSLAKAIPSIAPGLEATNTRISELELKLQQLNVGESGEQELQAVQSKMKKLESLNSNHNSMLLEMKTTLHVMDDKLKELEQHVIALQTSFDGLFVWKISGFKQKLSTAKTKTDNTSFYSQPFYTHPYGYKLCAKIYLNGDGSGRGKYVSLFIVVMQGDYDDALPWPFRANVSFVLVDQSDKREHLIKSFQSDPKSNSFCKPKDRPNVACGCVEFVSHEELEFASESSDSKGRIFIKNDVAYFKVIVDSPDLRSV